MEKPYDYLIVGAGLFGSTFAWLMKRRGKRCLVVDRRNHAGGNIYCENIDGINVHKYGAHIFHTSNEGLWKIINHIVPFNRYTNAPLAIAPDGNLYNLPFNMNTFYEIWKVKTPAEALKKLNEQRTEALAALGGKKPSNLEEQALTLVGKDIYNLLIKEYTEKQWGRECRQLPPDIIKRLPVRLTFDNNYFNDVYQGIPIGGYNRLIEGLLEGVEVKLGCDFLRHRNELEPLASCIVYTGPIDRFFDFVHGHLQYRTVNFETEVVEIPNYQGNAVVNYISSEVKYTRIIEHKHFGVFGDAVYDNPVTVISKEYSSEWNPSVEPYYPVNDGKNNALYEKYSEMVRELNRDSSSRPGKYAPSRWIFGGRLAEYRYYDMDKVMERAISLSKKS